MEIKAELLEKRRSCPSSFSPYMNLKGPEDSLDIFPVKVRVSFDCFPRRKRLVSGREPVLLWMEDPKHGGSHRDCRKNCRVSVILQEGLEARNEAMSRLQGGVLRK